MKYAADTEHMVCQKAWIGVLLGCLAQFALGFFSSTDHQAFPEKQNTSIKKMRGDFTVKFSFFLYSKC